MLLLIRAQLSLFLFFASFTAYARTAPAALVTIDAKFAGEWKATQECERHPSWPDSLSLALDPKNPKVLQVKNGAKARDLNTPSEVVKPDSAGLVFRTVSLPESYNNGRQLVVGSIWKHESPKKTATAPAGLSVMIMTYTLKDDATLVFEKYGYSSEERAGADMEVVPYSKDFPKNYRCVYKRS